tara:strand:+ start:986 stop:1186 length:201 start_codon:yes stop_codon:yes gene_type:complete
MIKLSRAERLCLSCALSNAKAVREHKNNEYMKGTLWGFSVGLVDAPLNLQFRVHNLGKLPVKRLLP